jgi:predicted DNA-binding protein
MHVPDEIYEFSERTYEKLTAANVAPLAVLDVLHGQRRLRRHIGSFLQIAGQDRDGHWLGVALIETQDDRYEVTSARYLDADRSRRSPGFWEADMSKFDDADAALEDRDWSGAHVEVRASEPQIVQSVRMPRDLTERLFAEAARRGTTPSQVIRDLVEAGLNDVDESATVRLADVRRAIESLATRAA